MRKRSPGFTLVELLVAIFIAAVMVGVVFYLFGQLQRGTRASLLRAQMSLTAMTMDARLRDDAAGMLGPNRAPGSGATDPAAGCLVIVPALREGYVPLPNGSMSKYKVRLRSDQLVFFSRRDPNALHPWVSLIPKDRNLPPDVASYEARVWYGAIRDGNVDSTSDEAFQAHHWMVGRDLKLVRKAASGTAALDLRLQTDLDYTPQDNVDGLKSILPSATTWNPTYDPVTNPTGTNRYDKPGWTDAAYLANLIGSDGTSPYPNSQTNYTNPPLTTPVFDLKRLQNSTDARNDPQGVQVSDLAEAHMRLLGNCSEIIVQFAGDLDKDGMLDTYPIGHPLAGALIWYPEEFHANGTNCKKDASTLPKLGGDLRTKYNAIKLNDWFKSFPAGFAPALGVWPAGRFGAMPASGDWKDRFQFDYGETDNAAGQAASTPNVPAAYVFRFEDDQYRLVNHGFRQDGSVYANKFDAKPKGGTSTSDIANFPAPATTQRHWTPFPPTPAAATINPTTTQLYTGRAAPAPSAGSYPLDAATPAAADGTNFGDMLGDQPLPAQSAPPYTAAPANSYRTANNTPDATHPNGQLIPSVTQVGGIATAPSADSAAGAEPVYTSPYALVPGDFGPNNNHAAVYSDLWRQWFKAINDPAKAGTKVDWRNPQSDWPKLVRIRLRLNDPQGLVFSYSDEALINGRDDDGDGIVDNPEEGRMSGVWYEYVIAVPYPLDPAPHGHGD